MKTLSPKRKSQQLRWGLLLLLSFVLSVLVHTVLWRLWTTTSSPLLWLVFTLAIVGTFLMTLWVCVRDFCIGPSRLWTLGWFMLVTTPLVWVGCYTWDAFETAHGRGSLRLTTPIRITAIWICGVGETEMVCRYPKRTYGEHVELIADVEYPSARSMVTALDEHAVNLAAELEQPLPPGRIHWVRGDLLGFSGGRNILSIAICDSDIDELQYLDYHEIAHAVITRMAGPDQDPPMILAEGWAQSHSAATREEDRTGAISNLVRLRDAGETVSITEWTEQENYGKSVGPAYTHGAALVTYLLERFGGPKFFDLYKHVRRETFADDAQQVLGVEWTTIESDFWAWLDREAEKLNQSGADSDASKVKFAKGVDPQIWENLLVGCRRNVMTADRLPTEYAFKYEMLQNGKRVIDRTLVRRGENYYLTADETYKRWTMRTPAESVALKRIDRDGKIELAAEEQAMAKFVRNDFEEALRHTVLGSQFGEVFETVGQELDFQYGVTVEKVIPPDTVRENWHAEVRMDRLGVERHYDVELSSDDFQILNVATKIGDHTWTRHNQIDELFGVPVPVRVESTGNGFKVVQTLSQLSDEKTDEIVAEIETVIRNGPDPIPPTRWYEKLIPGRKAFPVVWLPVGLVALVLSWIKRPFANGSE